jgi:hypothetical protein
VAGSPPKATAGQEALGKTLACKKRTSAGSHLMIAPDDCKSITASTGCFPMRRRRPLLYGAAIVSGCSRSTKPFNAADITGANYARRLELPDADGRLRTLDEFKGKVTVVF